MKNILLLGELGKKFGREFRLDVKTPAEAVRALCANFKDFEGFVASSDKRNVGYRVIVGKQDVGADGLHDPVGNQEIKIVPVIAGAGGGGIGKIIIGAALIVASFFIPGSTLAIAAALETGIAVTTMATAALYVGAALVLQGTAQMLTPTPTAATVSDTAYGAEYGAAGGREGYYGVGGNGADNSPSYVFNGAVNTTAQGHPVPIGYGRMMVGSAVISAGITVEEIAP